MTVCASRRQDGGEGTFDAEALRERVTRSLRQQGFRLTNEGLRISDHRDKNFLRQLHSAAVRHRVEQRSALRSKEPVLVSRIAAGTEVDPFRVSPRLIEVQPKSQDELLFRYAALHWSVPVSSGYGRRLRFLAVDRHNDKLIGIIGLGDPVFGLAARDHWVGWTNEQRRSRLRHVLDAYVLGAVPPYSSLLGGKLMAMLATSKEVQHAFKRKYDERTALISGLGGDASVAMITTTSALGRSSMYNRLRFHDRLLFEPVGYTSGSGEFHFANGLYEDLLAFARATCTPTAKNGSWGIGFRNRREVVRNALRGLGLPLALNYHGVQRQVYVAPLAINTRPFLQGKEDVLDGYCEDAGSLFGYFRERWLIPRAQRTQAYRDFDPKSFLLWQEPSTALPAR